MIKILRMEVHNFRSIGHAVVEPLTDGGLTAVNGPNGAGKTSLLAGVLFALYAVTPDGVPIKALRRQGSTEEVKVVLTFVHDNQTITIERGLKGIKDSHYAKIVVDGREQVFGKVTAAAAWVQDRLGLDKEGFLAAFAIRQKELDGLVKAKPAERRALIERLAGIDKMSTAVQTARAEESDAKKRLDLLPGSGQDLITARKALEAAQTAAIEAWEAFESARDEADAAKTGWAQAQQDAAELAARVEAHTQAVAKATTLRHEADLAAERARSAASEVSRLEAEARGGSEEDLAAAKARHAAATHAAQDNRDARERAERATAEVGREEQRVAQATARATRLKAEASKTAKVAKDTAARAAAFPADLDTQVEAAVTTADTLGREVGALRGEYERLGASIKALAATTDPECPTCSTSLANPAALLGTLRQAQDRVKTAGAEKAAAEKAARQAVADLRAQADQARSATRDAQYAAEQAAKADADAQAAQAEADEATAHFEALKATSEVAVRAAQAAVAEQVEVAAEVEAASAALRRAETAAAAAAALTGAQAAAAQASEAARQADTAAQRARADADALAIAEDVKEVAREAFRTAQERFRTAGLATERAEADHRVAQEQVGAAERHRDAEDAKVKARAEALADYELKSAVRTALDAFRKERIAAIAPELSEAATDLIPKMTDGKFVAIELDEEFTPVITDDQGLQRPVTWLSGGEESAVALALRLALGEIIAGSAGGLLWMDEPQTAMDAARRPAMMSAVRAIPGRQVIIISHVSEATDMVDLVLDVVPDPDFGSTVIVSGFSGATEVDLAGVDQMGEVA